MWWVKANTTISKLRLTWKVPKRDAQGWTNIVTGMIATLVQHVYHQELVTRAPVPLVWPVTIVDKVSGAWLKLGNGYSPSAITAYRRRNITERAERFKKIQYFCFKWGKLFFSSKCSVQRRKHFLCLWQPEVAQFQTVFWYNVMTFLFSCVKDKNFNEVHEKVDKSSTYVEKDT